MQRKITHDILLVLVCGGPLLQNLFTDFTNSLNKKARNHSTHQRMHIFLFLLVLRPNAGQGLLIHEVSRSHTMHHSQENPLDDWSARRRDLYLTTHNTHNRKTSTPVRGIRTHNLSRRAAAALRFRPRGHWDRHECHLTNKNTFLWYCNTFRRHLRHLLTLKLSSI